jgi:hypothetical protein
MPDINLEGDHPRIISAKFGWDWLCSFRGEDFFLISSPFFLFLAWWPSWLEVGITGHTILEGGHPRTIPPKLVAIGPVVSEEKIFMWISHRVLQYTQGHIVVDHLQRQTACHVWLGVYRFLLIAHLLCEYLIVAKLGVVNLYLKVIKLWLTCTCSCIYLITHYNFNSIILDK